MQKVLDKIKQLANDYDMSISDIAKEVGKSKNTFYNYFNGKTTIDLDTLDKIAKVFSISLVDLFTDYPSDTKQLPEDTETLKVLVRNLKEELKTEKKYYSNLSTENEVLEAQIEGLKKEIKRLEQIVKLQERYINRIDKD